MVLYCCDNLLELEDGAQITETYSDLSHIFWEQIELYKHKVDSEYMNVIQTRFTQD
jgi:hypothetical protein